MISALYFTELPRGPMSITVSLSVIEVWISVGGVLCFAHPWRLSLLVLTLLSQQEQHEKCIIVFPRVQAAALYCFGSLSSFSSTLFTATTGGCFLALKLRLTDCMLHAQHQKADKLHTKTESDYSTLSVGQKLDLLKLLCVCRMCRWANVCQSQI